jgi:demethylmenaquinone methyltransferase / 2-methoxy-6-polyprenyl-1,4-benzoquinol methylase
MPTSSPDLAVSSKAPSPFSLPSQSEKPTFVKALFERLARYYDMMNDVMTAGLHRRWKQDAIRHLALTPDAVVLDLCCGTGDLALSIQQQRPEATVIGLDFSANMLAIAHERANKAELQDISFQEGDALHLPFADNQFDGVVQAYGLRNVADYERNLQEVFRVLKPGGRFVILDMSHPRPPISWLSHIYRFSILPLVGKVLARDENAYRYLTNSIFLFLTQDQLAQKLEQHGFKHVAYKNIVGGVCALHWSKKT